MPRFELDLIPLAQSSTPRIYIAKALISLIGNDPKLNSDWTEIVVNQIHFVEHMKKGGLLQYESAPMLDTEGYNTIYTGILTIFSFSTLNETIGLWAAMPQQK